MVISELSSWEPRSGLLQHHTSYECWVSSQLGHTSLPHPGEAILPNHFLPCLLLSAMSGLSLTNFQVLGFSGRVQPAYSGVGSCQVRPGDTVKGIFCIPDLPVQFLLTYNQEPTHSFLPETQHPISKIKHPQTDSELVFSTRQRTKPPGSQPHSHTLYTSTLELRITVEKLPSLGELLSKDCERGIGILGASKTPPHLPPLPPTYTKSQLPANVCHFKGKENNFFKLLKIK